MRFSQVPHAAAAAGRAEVVLAPPKSETVPFTGYAPIDGTVFQLSTFSWMISIASVGRSVMKPAAPALINASIVSRSLMLSK